MGSAREVKGLGFSMPCALVSLILRVLASRNLFFVTIPINKTNL